MKIVSYNINKCTQKKIDELFKNDADVYVVPEIAREDKIKLPDGYEMKWIGDESFPSKGLGVIWKKGRGEVPKWYDKTLHYAIPVFVDDILIVGIWPTKLDKRESYTQIAKDILDHYSKQIKENKTIVTGDFNLYLKEEKKNKDADLQPINELLKSLGLTSVYHEEKNIAVGQETEATYYHQFKKEQPFFLDYTYANMEIEKYKLLDWDKEMSDHVGQIIQIKDSKEEVTMVYDEIMQEITFGLSGDSKKDFKYLQDQCDKYKDSEYGTEIVRACGRLMANLLTDEQKAEISKVIENHDLGIETTLEEVRFNQYQKNFDKALSLLEPLVKKVEKMNKNGMFADDKVSEYYCFGNIMEEILYSFYAKPERELRHSDIDYAAIYMQYGSLLIDLERWDDAQKALEKAREWNPVSAHVIFELCETYKYKNQLQLYFDTVKDAFKFAYEPKTVARCYRNLGWYFVEEELYDEAIAVYMMSLQFEKSDFVGSEMFYISQKTGKQVSQPTLEDIKKVAEKYGFPVGAHKDVVGIAYSMGMQALEADNKDVALFFLGIVYSLTEADEVGELIAKLKKEK